MKKILKFLLSLTSIAIVSANSLITVACGCNYWTVYDVYNEYFYGYPRINKNNPYYSFITDYRNKTKLPASPTSMKEFDDLQINPVWKNFQELKTDLTTTKLSDEITINVNWNDLYSKSGLDVPSITKAENLQLNFYNAIAKVYQKTNILRLLQNIRLAPTGSKNTIAYNRYYWKVASQTQTYGKDFVNQILINEQYNGNYWNSNHLNCVSMHEYGHALSNYIDVPSKSRKFFNTRIVDSTNYKQNILGNDRNYYDLTQVLMDYLDTKITITASSAFDKWVENFLFPLIVVNSGYSSISFRDRNLNERNEFFAEAFNLWLGTDGDKRTWKWELLNDFFMHYLPTFANLKNPVQ
ncbi:hypothetical protein [Spiroplasma sp. AdecLV25b]|uniref:hypothetical protein n=1 Tax=Spiroplasma sp. AdecLV25b TaxID=3027162 RepID=UPI0027E201BD|nr:hypothetical protein [Spiroplasma sp. AdecLV25b]